LRATGETLAGACADLTLYPQKLINVRMPAGFDWAADAGIKAAVKAAETTLDGNGRVLLRPSGTEPLLRVMVEGREDAVVLGQAEAIAGAVRQAFGA
jgi:phosphoglucosamine mutase